MSATPITECMPCQIIVSSKYLAIASRENDSGFEAGDNAEFLQNIAAEALARRADGPPLTMVEKVSAILFVAKSLFF